MYPLPDTLSIWVGFDPREAASYAVTRASVRAHLRAPMPVRGLDAEWHRGRGLLWRATERRQGPAGRDVLWDVISDAPQATEHAIARFLIPFIAPRGWALFMDGDMLVRADLSALFEGLDPEKALYCVKHRHEPAAGIKMDGQAQLPYARKNWSSLMIWNVGHPAHGRLHLAEVNEWPGRDLHRFRWLDDGEIGEIAPEWNWLAGVSDPSISPKVVHYTEGTPDMPGYEGAPYADEWRAVLREWAR
jgi:hypothetical protein